VRRPRSALLALLAAAVFGAIAFVVIRALSSSPDGGAELAEQITVRTMVTPRPVAFGDRMTARAEVVVDGRRVDPDSVRVTPDFAPFTSAAPAQSTRAADGDAVSLRYGFLLACLSEQCVPRGDLRTVKLPVLRVDFRLRNGNSSSVGAVWPEVQIARRVPPADVAAAPPPWRTQPLPDVSYRVSPSWLANVLGLVAAALLACAGLLVVFEVARRRRLLQEAARARDRLGRALELARQSVSRAPDDRRKALAQLARALAHDANGDRRLVRSARRLAWSRSDPPPDGVVALVDEVEREVRGR
jgi:hypothetical protein